MRILVTGGAGFIGSNLIQHLIAETAHEVLNLDKLTYAGNLASLTSVAASPRYRFLHLDLCDRHSLDEAFNTFQPEAVMHLAAESHVDRSIDNAAPFIQTNITGTYTLLEACRKYLDTCESEQQERFRIVHTSTDEVFGSLRAEDPPFNEETPYCPRSPYAASKASSDHLVRSWHHTYGLPTIVTHCSNNYGPYQFPEKLIPTVILKALTREPIPVYGKGENVRDWLYVGDHVRALVAVLENGHSGETYTIGGKAERRNIDLVRTICDLLDELGSDPPSGSHAALIAFVTDRPGHDLRYAIDSSKIEGECGWTPKHNLQSGLRKTVGWYLENQDWWQPLLKKSDHALSRRGLSNT